MALTVLHDDFEILLMALRFNGYWGAAEFTGEKEEGRRCITAVCKCIMDEQ